ncbi:PIN domain-containing protein [Microlunatus elymi]|uniref:Ribonuclease VapC n=1 Tax=Microlunatus elymi TaxID=2596828 RepID=A0A516PYL7_9ACTN|nr:TA system VapC family ribonuclease toxin [Microlunatus elymi]QDP96260.1 PIN domain-containing protein [Microlunatus elymi]
MTALLDVNVLLALFDSDHVGHATAWEWLDAEIDDGWASCAITENGFIRIISQPRYPHPIPPAQAIELLAEATATEQHSFWASDVTVTSRDHIDPSHLLRSPQITDSYLLSLAVEHDGRLVTFDQSIELDSVPRATAEHLMVL